MPFVYSTATNASTYCDYGSLSADDKNRGHHVARRKIVIRGGHGVATQPKGFSSSGIHTPFGVSTQVTDEELEFLLQNKSFQRHVAAGFMTYDKKKVEPSKRALDMQLKDGSAPLTPESFEESEHSTPDARIYKLKEKSLNNEPISIEDEIKARKLKSRKQ